MNVITDKADLVECWAEAYADGSNPKVVAVVAVDRTEEKNRPNGYVHFHGFKNIDEAKSFRDSIYANGITTEHAKQSNYIE